ncbi:MAG: adenylate/guanylate cyclase domain-containing protein [Kofleriaceae bacterium]
MRRYLISFIDLAGFARDAERINDDERLAEQLDRYYERLGDIVERADGIVVKHIGDGALIVFPPERGDDAVRALLELRDAIATIFAGWSSTLVVKLHLGDVVCGPFGSRGEKRFDVIGGAVNIAARLPTRNFAISAEAFRTLSADGRALFKKHTPPITYIPIADHRPSPMTKL